MAKGARRVLGGSSWTPDFKEPGHLPWAQIEETLGRSIPDLIRGEIFEARQGYFEALAAYNQGVPQQHVNNLRDRLRVLCGEIHRIKILVADGGGDEKADDFAKKILGKGAVARDIETAFDGLVWQYGGNIRNRFSSLASECLEIAMSLKKPHGFAPVTLSSPPDVLAFNDLYEKLADSAVRWNFTPTENSPNFINLVMWMIGWLDFKQAKNKIMNTRANHKKRIADE